MKTKKKNIAILYTCIFCLFPIFSQSQNKTEANFKLIGFLNGTNKKLIILGNKPASGVDESFKIKHFDSCYSVNDSFQFSFYITEPSWYSIEIAGGKGWKSFVATPNGRVKIQGKSDSLYKSKITGSVEDSIYYALTKGLLFPLYKAMSIAPRDSFKIYPKIINKAKYNFIKQNAGSFVVAKYLVEANSFNRINDSAELIYLQKCYKALSPMAKQFTCSKNAYYNLFVASKILRVKKKIPDFNFNNYNENPFDLYLAIAKEKKKYYLIDFWATWCAPCIAQLPNLQEVYEKFKDQGFGIIGYSLDIQKNRLETFLTSHKLEWTNVSDLQGDQSSVYKIFKLGTIPSNYLIDRNGMIVAENLTLENLEKILEKKLTSPERRTREF